MEGSLLRDSGDGYGPQGRKDWNRATRGVGVAVLNLALLLHVTSTSERNLAG